MLRLRRSRVVLVFAVICTGLVYHFNSHYNLDQLSYAQVEEVRHQLADKVKTVSSQIGKPRLNLSSQKPLHSEHEEQKPLQAEPEKLPKESIPPTPQTSSAIKPDARIDGPPIHWKAVPEHFPVAHDEIIDLPTGRPKPMAQIQYNFPKKGAHGADSEKLDVITKTFKFAWDGYKARAWGKDELRPVSGEGRQNFGGWGATLVDSLDTLWIMGLKADFREAVDAISKIDFTTSTDARIPVFEITIRYLGGLLGAYDISGQAYPGLLDKATELADVLMGAFDTPNRMPQLKYAWKPAFASQPHRASTEAVLAELGSLSMEFTRLAQLTKKAKYYDAIARVTTALQTFQNETDFPGIWPLKIDTSGCRKPIHHQPDTNTPRQQDDETDQVPSAATVSAAAASSQRQSQKRALKAETDDDAQSAIFDDDCEPQGLARRPNEFINDYAVGSLADSTYEYLVKEHVLLNGLESQYEIMYEAAIQAMTTKLLYRPMIPDADRHILQLAMIRVTDTGNDRRSSFEPVGSHLLCYAGGMFALGAKVFGRSEDLNIAKKLTDGCVWAGEVTATGIMPEGFYMMPCTDERKCPWDESRWEQAREEFYSLDSENIAHKQNHTEEVAPLEKTAKESSNSEPKVSRRDKIQSWIRSSGDTSASVVSAIGGALRRRQLGQVGDRASDSKDASPNSAERASKIQTDKQNQRWQESEGQGTQNLTHLHQEVHKDNAPWQDKADATKTTPQAAQTTSDKSVLGKKMPPKGMTKIASQKYLLRPEAIESVFIMYRTTGDTYWRTKGWQMFEAIEKHTKTAFGASSISDVFSKQPNAIDEMQSFWLAETLKYFYLLFSDPSVVSLDEYVL